MITFWLASRWLEKKVHEQEIKTLMSEELNDKKEN
jgi:hypothetical protein